MVPQEFNTRHLAQSALIEISEISMALREFIQKHDDSGEIVVVSRGMLARVQALSEAVTLVLDGTPGPGLFELVHCRKDEEEVPA